MALINNSAELALECSLDKLWVDYDWYYKWKCFFLHKKWTDKYTCVCIRYSKLHDIKSDKYTHEIFHKIKNMNLIIQPINHILTKEKQKKSITKLPAIFPGQTKKPKK